MYRIGIVDSSASASELCEFESKIKEVLEEPSDFHFFSGEEELEDYYNNRGQVDIIFMDIKPKEYSKVKVVKKIQDMYSDTKVIFMSDDPWCAESIFEADPSAFLIKRVQADKLESALARIIHKLERAENSYVTFTTRNKVIRIKSNDIYYVESDRRLLYIHGKSLRQELYGKLDDFLKNAAPVFLRTHKSYAVNMNWIKSFSADGVELYDGRKVPVSRPKYKEARETFIKFCGGGGGKFLSLQK